MSGFEVIGVVLGVWPLVVNALDLYKKVRNSPGWNQLDQELRTEKIIYEEFVGHLLTHDLLDGASLEFIDQKTANFARWQDKELHSRLAERLGVDKTSLVLTTVQEIEKLLVDLNERLTRKEEPLERSKAGLGVQFRALRHNLSHSSIKKSLDTLHTYNFRLQRLFTNPPRLSSSYQPELSANSHRPSPQPTRQVSLYAKYLHDFFGMRYKCQCPVPHEATLGIRESSPGQIDMKRPFDLIYPVGECTIGQVFELEDSDIGENTEGVDGDSVLESNFSSLLSMQTWSRDSSMDTKESAITSVVETAASKAPMDDFSSNQATSEESRLIDDLCAFIRNLGETSPVMSPATCLGLIRLEERKYADKTTPTMPDDTPRPSGLQDGGGLVCLDDYLAPNHSWELTRQKRMALALSLSLTILQFFPTPWVSTVWTWKDFSMVRGERSQIFVTKKFSASHNRDEGASQPPPYETSPFYACFGEPVLTRLGCRLVELAIGQRLSDLKQPQQLDTVQDPDMLELWIAKEVMESGRVFQEAGECYNNAVQACLTHQVMLPEGIIRNLNSKHDDFQLDLEQFVVAPIRDVYSTNWGQIT